MDPLPTTRRVFTWFSLHFADESMSKWKKIAFPIVTFTCFVMILLLIFASIAFSRLMISSNLEEALFAFTQIIAFSTVEYMMIAAILQRSKINEIFEHLTAIYRKCK